MSAETREEAAFRASDSCVVCPKPALDGRIVCSDEHVEQWRQTVLAMPAGCERSGECVLPFRHTGNCTWGADYDDR